MKTSMHHMRDKIHLKFKQMIKIYRKYIIFVHYFLSINFIYKYYIHHMNIQNIYHLKTFLSYLLKTEKALMGYGMLTITGRSF